MSKRPDRWSPLRQLPLSRIATVIGYRRDPHDRNRFRRKGSVININGEKFYDHRQNRGGGAIDLVIHAEGTSFPEAVKRLRQLAGDPATEPEPKPEARRQLALPPPADAAWPVIHHWLTNKRALAPNLVAALRRCGLLYGDVRRNAVFLSTSGVTGRLPAWFEAWTPKRIICAFDADDVGDEAADRLAENDPRVRRLRPEGGKDWNDILAAQHSK